MAHWCNLAMQIFCDLPIITRFEKLIQSLYTYFAKSPKRHLKFTKLIKIIEIKEQDPTQCEDMLDLHVITYETCSL
jgi:hypothetical protein